MSLLVDDEFYGARILVWRVERTDNPTTLFSDHVEISDKIRNPLRITQKQVVKKLLSEIDCKELIYDELGKPHPVGLSGSLSISHSRNYVGLIYHPELSTGIDLEEPDGRIFRIARRFMHDEEFGWTGRRTIDESALYLVWGVKECVFKSVGGGGIIYRDEIRVFAPQPTGNRQGKGRALCLKKGQERECEYFYLMANDLQLVFTLSASEKA